MRHYYWAAAALIAAVTFFAVDVVSQPPPKKGPPPKPGMVLPPFVRDNLNLTARQRQQIDLLERQVEAQLRQILSPQQMQRFDQLMRRGPGGPGGPGGAPGGDGGPGAGGPGAGGPGGGNEKPFPQQGELRRGKSPFHKNVKVSFTEDYMIVESDGIPTHETGNFPNRDNPNRILKQNYRFWIPLHPKKAERTTQLPMGPIGVALNGIPFYNPYNREGKNAVEGAFAEVFDSCCGHPDQLGRYHYHKYPVCLHNPFKVDEQEGKHSPLIGYAFDGYAIYGPNDEDGNPPTNLDDCNGHSDAKRGYHYHVTSGTPYILGAYRGVVEQANFPRKGPKGPKGFKGPKGGPRFRQ